MEALGALREQLLLIQSMQHEGVLSAEARCSSSCTSSAPTSEPGGCTRGKRIRRKFRHKRGSYGSYHLGAYGGPTLSTIAG